VPHILAITTSVSGDRSVSSLLVEEAVQHLLDVHPEAVVTRRDLGREPIGHLRPETVAGVRAVANSEAELAARNLSDTLIGEVFASDVIVIGSPMYNFSIPSGLRTWFDHVIRPRVTFAYGETGVRGLVSGKRAIVIQSRGGFYSEGPLSAVDFQEPYLRHLLGFIGVSDVRFVHAERISLGPEARDAAIAHARSQIAAITAEPLAADV
jgi:FMN-dependent NADH-azoreductase